MSSAAIPLETIRTCLEGLIPSLLASCSRDGVPNVTYVSHVMYVDARHVALTFQFFNKTRENILGNPLVAAFVGDTSCGARYVLKLRYLRTEDSGPTFESMKARLAGIASHSGMAGVFHLRGADIYEVQSIEALSGPRITPPPRRYAPMSAVRQIAQRIAAAADLRLLLDDALAALEEHLQIPHAKVLLVDSGGGRHRRMTPRLYTVASRGYETSGVGSEIPLGHGVIGVAAREAVPIRLMHATSEYTYSRTARAQWIASGATDQLETEIPLPGLAQPASQLAVPIVLGRCTVGVLYVESEETARFTFEDEDALLAIATHLGATIAALQTAADSSDEAVPAAAAGAPVRGEPLLVRRYAFNDSVFVDNEYLIKGVAGAILWKLVREHAAGRRADFTNRELRLDPTLKLPDISDNLEARLILLARRLEERVPAMRIAKTGRGRFRLDVSRPLKLSED
jgi:adenylate cyclase